MTSGTSPMICDVRMLLSQGLEPFPHIMSAVAALAPGQAMELLAPFRPSPLIQLMERRGFVASTSERVDGTWVVLFTPAQSKRSSGQGAPADWPDPTRLMDLTGYLPAAAEAEVRQELALLSAGEVLFAVLPKEPVTLCQSLDQSGARWLGQWDPLVGGYAIMIQRAQTAHRAVDTGKPKF